MPLFVLRGTFRPAIKAHRRRAGSVLDIPEQVQVENPRPLLRWDVGGRQNILRIRVDEKESDNLTMTGVCFVDKRER